jgi:oxygen-dependent protoporphyrinogen oxidase
MSRVVIVGGGIAGLAAAYELAKHPEAEVVLLEAGHRLGGKIETQPFAGLPVELGPDTFLARVPWAVDLCKELGLFDELVSPDQTTAYLWVRGALRRLPEAHVLGVPTDFDQLAASGLVSPEAVDIARRDLDHPEDAAGALPGDLPEGDCSVGELIRSRLGDEVLERIVDPLIGGINAGDSDHLSVAAAAPQIADAARRNASLVRGLLAMKAAAPPDPGTPMFYSLPGGLQRLVDRVVDAISAEVHLGTPATGIERRAGGGYAVHTAGGPIEADAVVLASPAFADARLLEAVAPEPAATLGAIDYSSVALVTLAVPADAVERPLDASGYLVPRTEGCLITACTWASSKWAHLAAPGQVLLRASAGRYGDERIAELDDDALVAGVRADLGTTMDLDAEPTAVRVVRWTDSFPQYTPGHLQRMAVLDAQLAAEVPGVVLAGAVQKGVGIPACIRQGREAATAALDAATAG